jgi:hypothetical protein
MQSIAELLVNLPEPHRTALEWFLNNKEKEIGWPDPLPDGTLLINRAKGIHKPANWKHALSVREVLKGPYEDTAPQFQKDGSWIYRYRQESNDPYRFTNRALAACMNDNIPVGVLRQVNSGSESIYKVWGLALITKWENGVFTLIGTNN